jgi:NAD(P)H-hydrate epimerase
MCSSINHVAGREGNEWLIMENRMQRIENPPPLPGRPLEGHKGMFGRVLVVGGNEGMIGAPVLAGTAALKMGAGLVQIAVPRSILSAALAITPELIGLGLGKASGKDQLLEAAEKADAVAIGPGLGRTPEAAARVIRLVRLQKPMVIDADALNILASEKRWPSYFKAEAVLTPHPGEMSRLGKLIGQTDVPDDDDGRIALAVKAAKSFGQVMLLKGNRTVVTDGSRVYLNLTGNSALSKAGTGDVLSGIIAALLAQKMDRFNAAVLGAFLHGRAGELAGEKHGLRSVLARDVVEALELAIVEMGAGAKRAV